MARMTPWTPATEQDHDDDTTLCYFVSRDNRICWERATKVWHKGLGTSPVCAEHYEELRRAKEERCAGTARAF